MHKRDDSLPSDRGTKEVANEPTIEPEAFRKKMQQNANY